MAMPRYGPMSERVEDLIDLLCRLTPSDVATLIEAYLADVRPSASEEQQIVDELARDVRDPIEEGRAFTSARRLLLDGQRLADLHRALTEAWSCIPVATVGRLAPIPDGIHRQLALTVIDRIVAHAMAGEVASDLLTLEDYNLLTRAFRWSGLWEPVY
jgi:hypothetical protein